MGKVILLCVCFCGIFALLGMILWNNRHPPGGMKGVGEEGKGWLTVLYPTAYKVHIFWRQKLFPVFPEEKIRKLQRTRLGKTREELEEYYDCERIGGILLLILLTMGMVLFAVLGENSKQILHHSHLLVRGEPGTGDRQVRLHVSTGQEKKEITLVVPERQYRREELEAKFAEAKEYVTKQYLGDNTSSERITKPLRLVAQIPDSQIKIRWKLDSNGCVNKDGSLNNRALQEKTEILLTAVLSYEGEKIKVPFSCTVYPLKRTEEELFWEEWEQKVDRQKEQTAQENSMPLPDRVADKGVSYREVCPSIWPRILLAGMIFCLLLPSLFDYQTEQEAAKRERELKKEYPEIVERFILLINAGLTIRGAWYRITDDYLKRCQRGEYLPNYLYEEMLITRREMENGQSEAAAYAAFGRRLSMLQYMKFSTLLVQNLKKGSDDLLKRMDMEAVDALRERREMAKKLGEEAGTKLLFPMMLMLMIVFAMILIAAFYSM